jgi:hypothetical protein
MVVELGPWPRELHPAETCGWHYRTDSEEGLLVPTPTFRLIPYMGVQACIPGRPLRRAVVTRKAWPGSAAAMRFTVTVGGWARGWGRPGRPAVWHLESWHPRWNSYTRMYRYILVYENTNSHTHKYQFVRVWAKPMTPKLSIVYGIFLMFEYACIHLPWQYIVSWSQNEKNCVQKKEFGELSISQYIRV